MPYEPTNWKSGDVVTSAKLNKMEQGIAGAGVLVVNATTEDDTTTLGKTWQEIYDAGFCVICIEAGSQVLDKLYEPVLSVHEDSGNYLVAAFTGTETKNYVAASASGYPAYEGGGK